MITKYNANICLPLCQYGLHACVGDLCACRRDLFKDILCIHAFVVNIKINASLQQNEHYLGKTTFRQSGKKRKAVPVTTAVPPEIRSVMPQKNKNISYSRSFDFSPIIT